MVAPLSIKINMKTHTHELLKPPIASMSAWPLLWPLIPATDGASSVIPIQARGAEFHFCSCMCSFSASTITSTLIVLHLLWPPELDEFFEAWIHRGAHKCFKGLRSTQVPSIYPCWFLEAARCLIPCSTSSQMCSQWVQEAGKNTDFCHVAGFILRWWSIAFLHSGSDTAGSNFKSRKIITVQLWLNTRNKLLITFFAFYHQHGTKETSIFQPLIMLTLLYVSVIWPSC